MFKWNGKPNSKWVRVEDVVMELPRDTVLEVEFVQTFKGEVCKTRLIDSSVLRFACCLSLCLNDLDNGYF